MTLSSGQIKRIYAIQKSIGVDPQRLDHVKMVAQNGKILQGPNRSTLFNSFTPENKAYEKQRYKQYLELIEWLYGCLCSLSSDQKSALEAAVHLHDIGYAVSKRGDHPERGFELLMDERGDPVWEVIAQPDNEDAICNMVRYSHLYTDVGVISPFETMDQLSTQEKSALVVICALDVSAKPSRRGEHHSMLFSRVIREFQDLMQGRRPPEGKIRRLFGPIHYNWLDKDGLNQINRAIRHEGVDAMDKFQYLLQKTYFLCWPLLKDLATQRIIDHNESYYTYIFPPHASHLARFLYVICRVLEEIDPNLPVEVDTRIDYFKTSERPAFINHLRNVLKTPFELNRTADNRFQYGALDLLVDKTPDSVKVELAF